jgi:5-formyltetrahydrofolate cyclo-ligase
MPASSTKQQLRRHFDAVRRDMDPSAVRRRSERVAEHVTALPAIQSATCVHAYWPMLEQNEVDTRPIIDALVDRGVTVVLPVVTSFEAGAPSMTHRTFTGRSNLQVNAWSIAEPTDGREVELGAIDAVIVPALGAGRNGHRIGHGWGYYDQFLSELSPDVPRILPVYDACVKPEVPHDSHDQPVDVIVTESGAFTVSPADEAAMTDQP